MAHNRDQILKDLKEYVIEVFFKDTRFPPVRCTLRTELLPKNYVTEQETVEAYHTAYKNAVAAWNVAKGGWTFMDINDILYLQVIDGY